MIVLTRRQARAFLAVLRRCRRRGDRADPLVVARAGKGGASLEAGFGEVALRLAPGPVTPDGEQLAFPASALAPTVDADAADGPLRLAPTGPGRGRLTTVDGGGAERVESFATVDLAGRRLFPEAPAEFRPVGRGFVAALREASRSAAGERGRFALQRVLLRGTGGQVVGTDATQLLVQTGFDLPWTEDVLVPATDAWAAPELAEQAQVAVGRTPSHVVVRAGPWAVALPIDPGGRYPPFEAVLPKPSAKATRVGLSPAAVKQLLAELPRLPGKSERHAPVRLEVGPHAVVRAGGREGHAELELPDAQVAGPAVATACDRRHLLRALRLGFTTVHVPPGGKPLFCRDARRTYLFLPAPMDDHPKPPAAEELSAAEPTPPPTPEDVMPAPPTNGPAPPGPAPDPLAEAEAVRGLLHEAQLKLGRLLAALRHHRRHARAVSNAVRSLRQLPPLGP